VYDPFTDTRYAYTFSDGETVVISGTGFGEDQAIPLGVYSAGRGIEYEKSTLVYRQLVRTDSSGDFVLKLVVEAGDPPGSYAIVMDTDEIVDLSAF
jgi:hypothetical protein